MILTLKLDLDSIKTNQHAKYLGQSRFVPKLLNAHTHIRTDCFTWTTKLVGKITEVSAFTVMVK